MYRFLRERKFIRIAGASVVTAFVLAGCAMNFHAPTSRGTSGFPTQITSAQLLDSINGVADSWAVVGGATSMDITATLHESGSIYYVVYNADPGPMTADQIKAAALGSTGGSLVNVGTLSVGSSMQSVSAAISGMADSTTYYVRIAAEGAIVGLYPDASTRSFTQVNPDQLVRTNIVPSIFNPAAGVRYMTYFPEAYYKESIQTYPLLIVLHGFEERAVTLGDDTDGNFETVVRGAPGLMRYIEDGTIPGVPMVVIQTRCPQYVPGGGGGCWNWSNSVAMIDEVLEDAKANLRIDVNRIYISGLSTGGAGAVKYAKAYPSKIAAVAPIAMPAESINCGALSNIPFWFFHNESDPTQPSANSVAARDDLLACPSTHTPKLTRYAGSTSHNAWKKTYDLTGGAEMVGDDPYSNLYTWLLSHSK